jgi:hypothetical protein
MKNLAMFFLLWIPLVCLAQQWDPINENNESVSFFEFLPTSYFGSGQSLYYSTSENFTEIPFMLDVTDGIQLNDSCVLITMGNGTYSDGIYKINLNTGASEVMEYNYKPQVLKKHNGAFYCGFWGGISKSEDGSSWTQIHTMPTDSIITDLFFDDNMIIALGKHENTSFVIRSENNAPFEYITQMVLPHHATAYDIENHKLYVGLYAMSDSDGLYVSNDYGNSFELVRYMDSINALYLLNENQLAIGVANHTASNNGIFLYDIETNNLNNLSGNLPDKNIINITSNPLMNCLNLVACTPNGAFISCDALGTEEIVSDDQKITIYPNPTGSDISIAFEFDISSNYSIEILNMTGKLLLNKVVSGLKGESVRRKLQFVNDLEAGIYLISVKRDMRPIYSQKLIKY